MVGCAGSRASFIAITRGNAEAALCPRQRELGLFHYWGKKGKHLGRGCGWVGYIRLEKKLGRRRYILFSRGREV